MSDDFPAWDTVWIVGASSGIGRELSLLLDGIVSNVAISARSEETLEKMQKDGVSLRPFTLDVTEPGAVSKCADNIARACGPIDLVVLCAGTWKLMDAKSFDLDAVRRGMEVNYMGVANVLAAVMPTMIERRAGHIAVVASVAGFRGLPRAAAYGPTKAALINLVETLQPELAAHGVTISIVNPGFVDTPMTADNPFPMPGLMPAKRAAEQLLSGLVRKKYEIIFPRAFGYSIKALRFLPNHLFFWLMRRYVLKQKSRRNDLP